MGEDIDGDAAAGVPVAADAEPFGVEFVKEALTDADGAIFMETGMVAEAVQIELERLGFHDGARRDVVDDEVREIGLAGDGAERGKFRAGEADHIGAGAWVRNQL